METLFNNTTDSNNIYTTNIIGTWVPKNNTLLYSDNSEYKKEYEIFNNNRLTFAKDGTISFINLNNSTNEKRGKWEIHEGTLTVDWGDRVVDEILFDVSKDTLKKGSYFYIETDRTLNYNCYEKIAG